MQFEHANRRRHGWLLGATAPFFVGVLAVAAQAEDGDVARGEALFGQCKTCHEIGEGAKNKVGPHLDGIMGRTAGTVDGFKYSEAMKKAGADGLAWDADAIAAYLEKPRDFIPGNRMSYRGMPDVQDRADLVAWLAKASSAAPAENVQRDGTEVAANRPTGFADIVIAMDGDPEYGEYLAGECVTCHQASGHADGIPSIVGLPKDYFVRALFEYKSNVRSNEVMKLRVANLANDEIAALAAYFSTLEPE